MCELLITSTPLKTIGIRGIILGDHPERSIISRDSNRQLPLSSNC